MNLSNGRRKKMDHDALMKFDPISKGYAPHLLSWLGIELYSIQKEKYSKYDLIGYYQGTEHEVFLELECRTNHKGNWDKIWKKQWTYHIPLAKALKTLCDFYIVNNENGDHFIIISKQSIENAMKNDKNVEIKKAHNNTVPEYFINIPFKDCIYLEKNGDEYIEVEIEEPKPLIPNLEVLLKFIKRKVEVEVNPSS